MTELKDLCPIGIGTYRTDRADRPAALAGLRYAVDRGQNMLSTGFSYGAGAVVELVGELLAQVPREALFLCVYVEPDIRRAADVDRQLEGYLRAFGTDYVDCLQIHSPYETPVPLEAVYERIFARRDRGEVRYVGAGNLSPAAWGALAGQVALFEGLYNFECRQYEAAGVLADCRRRGVRFVCYQPLRRNRTAGQNYPLLRALAEKYGCSQNQVILNWLVRWKGLQTIVKALTPTNIDENLAALDLRLEAADCRRMDAFRCPACEALPVDWDHSGTGVPIHLLANQF
ncbi:aldo/keto reductase [uncultured Oscillibacter sp.]|uniref:aldo/keto reductase n=1 Tax=uncultured Oscillibacter sp. TaxID=876091 RepID=UPI0025FD30EF|nr:aldo/keto reductase [uncultured Oscillibacter sp.]